MSDHNDERQIIPEAEKLSTATTGQTVATRGSHDGNNATGEQNNGIDHESYGEQTDGGNRSAEEQTGEISLSEILPPQDEDSEAETVHDQDKVSDGETLGSEDSVRSQDDPEDVGSEESFIVADHEAYPPSDREDGQETAVDDVQDREADVGLPGANEDQEVTNHEMANEGNIGELAAEPETQFYVILLGAGSTDVPEGSEGPSVAVGDITSSIDVPGSEVTDDDLEGVQGQKRNFAAFNESAGNGEHAVTGQGSATKKHRAN